MATASTDTSPPRALDVTDFVMYDHAETISEARGFRLHHTVPNILKGSLSEDEQIVAAAPRSQKSSSETSPFSYQSKTSTPAYEQTPFITFKVRVMGLRHLLWPPAPLRPLLKQSTGASGDQSLDFLNPKSQKAPLTLIIVPHCVQRDLGAPYQGIRY